ncbi:MAG: hypothetical protein HOM37_14285 [Acidimicrobiaceae bacterium]|jgi:hypothetical protein|nr:hypothetical protein [Acidimicrobiaceae bacterium]MDG1409259.1 hypothetical protein [Acidimicrobiales bacterium]MDG2217237.1 hypothetical protein [Acidimicrobiales bacterium]
MAKYVLAYHGGHRMPESEEGMDKLVAAWSTWFDSMGGSLLDGGNPVGAAKTINSDGSVSDGGGVNPLAGYSLIEAGSLDAAVDIAKGCPVIGNGGSVEVAEAMDM